jgi:hypothetical protein
MVIADTVFGDLPGQRGRMFTVDAAPGGSYLGGFKLGPADQEPCVWGEDNAQYGRSLLRQLHRAEHRNVEFIGNELLKSAVVFNGIRYLDALGGFTYVLDSVTGGFRIVKLSDANLAMVSQFFLPVGLNARLVSVDGEGSIYVMGRFGSTPEIVKLKQDGVRLPVTVPADALISAGTSTWTLKRDGFA